MTPATELRHPSSTRRRQCPALMAGQARPHWPSRSRPVELARSVAERGPPDSPRFSSGLPRWTWESINPGRMVCPARSIVGVPAPEGDRRPGQDDLAVLDEDRGVPADLRIGPGQNCRSGQREVPTLTIRRTVHRRLSVDDAGARGSGLPAGHRRVPVPLLFLRWAQEPLRDSSVLTGH
jgi:hypothetical protein